MKEYKVGKDVQKVSIQRLLGLYEQELDGIMFPQIGLMKELRPSYGKILCVDSQYGSKMRFFKSVIRDHYEGSEGFENVKKLVD